MRNTFKNAYNVPVSAVTPPLSPTKSPASPPPDGLPTSHHESIITTAPVSSPYQLPRGLKSILLNSPMTTPTIRRLHCDSATSKCSSDATSTSCRRICVPDRKKEKKVSYRQPLEEEIHTVHFIARHSDLDDDFNHEGASPSSDEGSDSSDSDLSSSNSAASSHSSFSTISSDNDDGNDVTTTTTTTTTKSMPVIESAAAAAASTITEFSTYEKKKRRHLDSEEEQSEPKRQIRPVTLLHGLCHESSSDATPQEETPQSPNKRRCFDSPFTVSNRDESKSNEADCQSNTNNDEDDHSEKDENALSDCLHQIAATTARTIIRNGLDNC